MGFSESEMQDDFVLAGSLIEVYLTDTLMKVLQDTEKFYCSFGGRMTNGEKNLVMWMN